MLGGDRGRGTAGMADIEYDRAKSSRNAAKHGVSFDFAAQVFDRPVIEWEDDRQDYGETRFVAVGEVEDNVIVVVDTWRSGKRRLISARRANRRERNVYRTQKS
jgi:hypothetical protein